MFDKMFLQGFEVRCIIGTLPEERRKKQKIIIDLEFPAPVKRAAKYDNLKDALNYQEIAKSVVAFVSKSRFYLIETLAERLAAALLQKFPFKRIKLRILKPEAIKNVKSAGVEIRRSVKRKRN